MNKNMKKFAIGSAAMAAGLLASTGAFATNPDPTGFSNLYDRAESDGRCSVTRVSGLSSTYYIPRDPSNSSARFNVLVWGNGTGGTSSTYSTLLESVASHCIAVAAANTANSGTGSEMEAALNGIRASYGSRLLSKVCTAGHSQGGGGSFNAANRIGADCVIPVQPDTVFTTRIYSDLDPDVEVITIWGESDTLAPRSTNGGNVRDAANILTEVETDGEGHFAPTSGRGGIVGTIFRMANIAELSNNSTEAQEFRRAFWGPSTDYTVTTSHPDISYVRRSSAAVSTSP